MGKEDFLERLYNEWRVEFAFEDHRFWDVRRWKIADTTQRELYGVKIEKQADGTFKFTAQGIYTAEFAVTVNEEIILQDSVKVYIKNHSTQPNAEANFDKGYFNGDLWAITEKGVAVKDGALIIAGGTFRTKGFSEICYFTFFF